MSTYTAIEYARTGGGLTSDIFCPACAGCGKDEVLCEFEVRGFCDHCGEYHWNARPSRRDEEADDWRRAAERDELAREAQAEKERGL